MTSDNLSTAGVPADGAATQPPTSVHGGLWKAGIAAAVVAGLALAFVGSWWFGTKRNKRSSDARGEVQLWEGSPYWAETNIGAEKPEDYGYYFWWGDTVGYKYEFGAWVASDGSARNFKFDEKNTSTYGKYPEELKSEGWITKDGVLAPKHDAAHVHRGDGWRMPTDRELKDLTKKCDWTRTTKNCVEGFVVRGRGEYASASIFLPSAGEGLGTSLVDFGSDCCFYWSSVLSSGGHDHGDCGAWFLNAASGDPFLRFPYPRMEKHYRYRGRTIRPVQGFTK